MLLRRLFRLRRAQRPRFETPGGSLALILFLLAALLTLWGRGAGKPDAEPPSLPKPPAPAARPRPVEPPVFLPEEPPPAPVPEEPASGCPEGCEAQPPGCDIKGNTSLRTGEKIYHVPGQQYYEETRIDSWKGERWFCTEEEAAANGWRKSKR